MYVSGMIFGDHLIGLEKLSLTKGRYPQENRDEEISKVQKATSTHLTSAIVHAAVMTPSTQMLKCVQLIVSTRADPQDLPLGDGRRGRYKLTKSYCARSERKIFKEIFYVLYGFSLDFC